MPIQKIIVTISNPNFRAAKMEARKGANAGKLVGDTSIKIRLTFSIASNRAAMNGINVM